MSRLPTPGDVYRVPVCTSTDGRTLRDVGVTARVVRRLGCGCVRLTADRPGPADGELGEFADMHVHVRRCRFHAANPMPGEDGTEPQRVHSHEWRHVAGDLWDCPGCDETERRAS